MSTILSIAGLVTRPELGLGDLTITGGSKSTPGYDIQSFNTGALSWRKITTHSPFVHGEQLVHAVKDVKTVELSIVVFGSTAADLHSRIATLARAFEQFTYQLSVTMDSVEYRYTCEPADYRAGSGEGFNKFLLAAHQQVMSLQIATSPIPIAGGI